MNLDKHRESLVKYCYDISKVAFAVAVLNPAFGQSRSLIEIAAGFIVTVGFLAFAIYLEK